MEQLTYFPYKCKLRLSRQELKTLSHMLGRLEFVPGRLQHRALAEWVVSKRMDFTRRLLHPRPHYNLTLGAIDAWLVQMILDNILHDDNYEDALQRKIKDHIARLL